MVPAPYAQHDRRCAPIVPPGDGKLDGLNGAALAEHHAYYERASTRRQPSIRMPGAKSASETGSGTAAARMCSL